MEELSLGSPSHLRYSQTGDRDRYRGGAMKREVGPPLATLIATNKIIISVIPKISRKQPFSVYLNKTGPSR